MCSCKLHCIVNMVCIVTEKLNDDDDDNNNSNKRYEARRIGNDS